MPSAPPVNPRQIAAFTQAARDGSFTAAARSLGVSQSAVTQHVARLEKVMGATLFVRSRTGLELTRAGRELFAVTDRLRDLEALVAERVAAYGAIEAGHLRVIANAPRPVMPIIARFAAAYPGVSVSLDLHDWTRAMELLRERAVDIGVITEPEETPGLWRREIGPTAYVALMRHDHRLAGRASLRMADLAQETVLLPEDGSFTRRIVMRRLAELDLDWPRAMQTRTFPLIKEGVLHGLGVGVLLGDSVHSSASLTELPIADLDARFRNFVVTHEEKRDLRLVRSFLDAAFAG